MKIFTSLLVSLIFTAIATADTEFPKGSYDVATLTQAKSMANLMKKNLAFIYTDKSRGGGAMHHAAGEYIDAVKSSSIIVHVDAKGTKVLWPQLPEVVRQGFSDGLMIPQVVVTDSTASKLLASLTYEEYEEDERKALREFKKALKAE